MSISKFALVVEDEFLIAIEAERILTAQGFQTQVVGDADAAMEVLSHRTDVDLLFTDIDIPGTTDGIGVAYLAHETQAAVIVVTSGRHAPGDDQLPPGAFFLEKPFDDQVVKRTIGRAA